MQHRTCVGNTHFTPRQCLASQTLLGEIGVLTFQPSLVGCVLCCLRQCSPVCSRNSTHRHSCSLLCQFYPGLPLVHSLLAARASVLFECLHESVGVPRTGLLKKFANQRHDKWSLALWRLQLGHPKGAQTWSPSSTLAASLPPRPRTTLGPSCGRRSTLTFNVAGWGIASWPPSGAPEMIPKLIHCGASGPEIRLPCRISAGFCFGKPQNRPSGAKAGRRADLDIFAMKNLAELRPGRPISGPLSHYRHIDNDIQDFWILGGLGPGETEIVSSSRGLPRLSSPVVIVAALKACHMSSLCWLALRGRGSEVRPQAPVRRKPRHSRGFFWRTGA
jgi:hypothetical protein